MQKFFKVEDYFESLEPWMKARAYLTRELILQTHPNIVESIKYNCAFYTLGSYLFYLSVYKKKQFVLGFCMGIHLPDPQGMLIADAGQTLIRHWKFEPDKEPDYELLASYIESAVKWNEKNRFQK